MLLRRLFSISVFLLVLAGAALFWSIRTYRIFTREELVAQVLCESAPAGAPHRFSIQWTPVENGQMGRSEKFAMTGDQWSVGGDFLKWDNWLIGLGLRHRHKPTRLSSRYWTASDERAKPRTAYDLNGGTSPPWRWVYRHGIRLPFVDAVYGTSAYMPARPGERWGVYVGQAGYLLRPLKERK